MDCHLSLLAVCEIFSIFQKLTIFEFSCVDGCCFSLYKLRSEQRRRKWSQGKVSLSLEFVELWRRSRSSESR